LLRVVCENCEFGTAMLQQDSRMKSLVEMGAANVQNRITPGHITLGS